MKNLLIIIFVSLFIFSCQEKLPTNIQDALSNYEFYVNRHASIDSATESLNKSLIDSMSSDQLDSIIYSESSALDYYFSASEDLEELLKFNPEYSDYDVIKNKIKLYRYRPGNKDKFWDNYYYIRSLSNYYSMSKYDDNYKRPIYGLTLSENVGRNLQ